MAERPPLSDDEAYEALYAAHLALGTAPGATVRADTALKAARKAMAILMFGLIKAGEDQSDRVEGIRGPGETSLEPPPR